MARKGRAFLITILVIVGLIVVAAAAVRLFFTREKLLAMVIPRIEKAIDAKVTIGDIGINFPFGLGVDISSLSFEKTLPDTSELSFTSEKVTVRSSLSSLLRRKIEIKAADVQGGTVTLTDAKKGREVKLVGLGARVSMKPVEDTYDLSAKVLADLVQVSPIGAAPALSLEKLGFDGDMESDRQFTRITIKKSKLSWSDVAAAKIEGEVTNVTTEPRVALTFESEEKPLAPVIERVRSFRLGELSRERKPAVQKNAAQIPFEITRGTFGFKGRIEGLAKVPTGMNVSFEGKVDDAALRAGDLASVGRMNASIKGEGVLLAWQSLFPSAEKPVTPAELGMAWRAVALDAAIDIEDAAATVKREGAQGGAAGASGGSAAGSGGEAAAGSQAPPLRISSAKAHAEIAGPDVKKISGEFLLDSSPYRFEGSMINIMPAYAEFALVARKLAAGGRKEMSDPGPLLDGMVNAPIVKFDVTGRSFDARPYQKPHFGSSGGAAASAPSTKVPTQEGEGGFAAPLLMLLKNTTFTAKLDSVIAREAVFTKLEAEGSVRDGRIRIDPVAFHYAGGKGKGIVTADARRSARIETKVDLSVEGIEAKQALGRISSRGDMVDGTFSLRSNGTIATGPGIDALMTLSAAGSALSSKGSVSIGSFLEPLAKIPGFDISPFREFNYSGWAGGFIVRDGRCITDDWKVGSTRGDWTIKGSFGFDGTIDYAVHVVIPPAVQAQMKEIDRYKSAFDLMRDASGNLILDIRIGGTAKRPSATLDLSKAKSKAQERAIEGLKKFLK